MNFTKLQYELEKACKNTIGKFEVDEKNKVVECSFDDISIAIDKQDNAWLNAPSSWARFEAEDIGNAFKQTIPKEMQGIGIKSKKIYAEINPSEWYINEKVKVLF